MPDERHPPDLRALFGVLAVHGVKYVVTGSTAALLHGVELSPGDLDVTPALDAANLSRLAAALESVQAQPDPDGPLGDWQIDADGEWRWTQRPPRSGERERRLAWKPDPTEPSSFDELLQTAFGSLDVVPEVSGRYDDLARRGQRVEAFGQVVLVASIPDQLATLTVARRPKDRQRVAALRERQRE